MTEQMNVPKLRFDGFKGDWATSLLPKVAKIERGKFTPRPRNNPIYYNGNIPFVQTSDVANSNGYISNYTQTLNEKGLEVSRLFPENTLLITIAANIGYTGVLQRPMACPDSLINLEPINSDPYFLHFMLSTHQRKMDNIADPGAQKNINKTFLSKYSVTYPTLPEQQKIASFLSKVDEKVTLLTEKKAKLTEYKKGVMQQLFDGSFQEQDGKPVFVPPTLRFKADDGSEFPDWEARRLKDYLSVRKDKNIDLEFSKQDVLSVSGAVGVVNQIEFQGRSYAGVSVAPYRIVRYGDVVYTKSPLKLNPYGIIRSNKGKDGIVSTLYAVYKCKSNIQHEFLDYYFQLNDNTNRYLRPLVNKGAKNDMKVNDSTVLNGSVCLPNKPEQIKIVKFLSTIDQKIDLANSELKKAKEWKKGLLQQMFV